MSELREQVRDHYARAAAGAGDGCCGGGSDCGCGEGQHFGSALYGADVVGLPEDAVNTSLGCGNPTAMVDLQAGDTVLDLGSGAGLDVLLSARRVGPSGTAYGVDMTDEMLELARANAERAGVANAVFLKGYIEDIPLPDAAVDVVLSNCVVNLSSDKPAVFSELARVLRPEGRLAISDIVADDNLTPEDRAERGSHVGCIAGALSIDEYRDSLEQVGFSAVEIVLTHEVADGMHAAIVRATRPD